MHRVEQQKCFGHQSNRTTEQQTSNPSEEGAAAGSVRRAANVMTHVSVDALVSLLHRWRGRLLDFSVF